jgi:hypothetical protein
LLFPSSALLTKGDTSSEGKQLFEYDSDSARLVRVSIGEDHSYNDDGNVVEEQYAPSLVREQLEVQASQTRALASQVVEREHRRVLTATGQVFFQSADKLTKLAVSTGEGPYVYAMNVYEYDPVTENVYLISDGQDQSTRGEEGEPATELGGASLTGGNVFFQTADQLVPQDTDTQLDIYDAREDGGFPAPVTPTPCGESCQGNGSPAPSLSTPTSAGAIGGMNLPPPPSPPPPVVKPKAKSKPAKCKKGFVKKKGECVRQPKAKKRAGKSNRSRKVGSR